METPTLEEAAAAVVDAQHAYDQALTVLRDLVRGEEPAQTAEPTPAPAKKRKRRTKAEMEAARAEKAEADAAKATDEAGDGDSGEEETKPRTRRRKKAAKRVEQEGPSVDDVRNALLKVIETYGNEGAAEVLEDFKVEKVSELGSDQYADVISAAADYLADDEGDEPAAAGALE